MKIKPNILAITGIILLAALSRIIPHPPNFTPVTAIALFGGAYFADKRFAFIVPLAAMLLSDLFLGFHAWLPFVYLSFMLIVGMGMFLRENTSLLKTGAMALGASTLFFIVTNLGSWWIGPYVLPEGTYYPITPAGLLLCFEMAIPFFHKSLAGDLFYTAALFGGYAMLKDNVPALTKA